MMPNLRLLVPLIMVGVMLLLLACDLEGSGFDVQLTFVNETDSSLCFVPSVRESRISGSCREIKANDTTKIKQGCGRPEEILFRVIVSVGPDERDIYDVTAPCKDWRDSDGSITIRQRGDDFVVTDALPDTSPGP
jgi:hypothetical protein